jgi:hypothetical protein
MQGQVFVPASARTAHENRTAGSIEVGQTSVTTSSVPDDAAYDMQFRIDAAAGCRRTADSIVKGDGE